MNDNWKKLNPKQKVFELKRQHRILGLEADFTFREQQALLAEAREIIKSLNGEKFGPVKLQDEFGIHEQAILIEGKKAGYVESVDTKNLVPKQYVVHIYELSAEAKSGRFVAALKKENEDLRAEVARLSSLQTVRKTNSKRKF